MINAINKEMEMTGWKWKTMDRDFLSGRTF
jgi:hypothetical protein